MNVVLIGYRGTGKTTIGRSLARRLGRSFFDSDDLVVKKAGKSILEIFKEEGEGKFREIEAEAILELSRKNNAIISCGGGAVLRQDNVKNLKSSGIVILLKASAETIFERIESDNNRPRLTDKSGIEEVRHLLLQRNRFYDSAKDFEVDTGRNSVQESVKSIIGFIKEKGVLVEKG